MAWKITPKMLADAHACKPQYRRFRRKWPNGMYVTKKNLRMMVKAGFDCADMQWVAEHLISDGAYDYCDAKMEAELGVSDCVSDCDLDCCKCQVIVNAFYATVKKFRSV